MNNHLIAVTTESTDVHQAEALPVAETHTTASTEASSSGGVEAGLKALGVDGKLLAAQILNFIILVIILRKFLYKPLLGLLEKRREQIEQSAQKADEIEKRYAEFQIEHQERIDQSKKEATELIQKAKESAELLKSETLSQTQAENEKLLERAKLEIEDQRQSMMQELKAEIGTLVIETTQKIIGSSIDTKTATRFIEEAVKEVK